MNGLLTEAIARSAVNLGVQAAKHIDDLRHQKFHIVVGNPLLAPVTWDQHEWSNRGGILLEHSVGKDGSWTTPYDDIARSKCYLTWRHQMPTARIQHEMPYLLRPGDTSYYGSAYEHGLAVACSGVAPYHDELIAKVVLAACIAECKRLVDPANSANSIGKNGFLT